MKKIKKEKIKFEQKVKFKKILFTGLYIVIIVCILYNIFFLINTSISQKNFLKVFGISFFSMKTDLMENDINKNDLVIVKEVEDYELQIEEIIAYQVNNRIRINKIVNKEDSYIITKSNKNYYPDIEQIETEQIIGKKIVNIPFLGILLNILQSKITSIFILMYLIYIFWHNKKIYIRNNKKRKRC